MTTCRHWQEPWGALPYAIRLRAIRGFETDTLPSLTLPKCLLLSEAARSYRTYKAVIFMAMPGVNTVKALHSSCYCTNHTMTLTHCHVNAILQSPLGACLTFTMAMYTATVSVVSSTQSYQALRKSTYASEPSNNAFLSHDQSP